MTRRIIAHHSDSAYVRAVRAEQAKMKAELRVLDTVQKLKLRAYVAPKTRESDIAWMSDRWME